MNVTVTREEIDQTKQLLDLLRQWEPIRSASSHYDCGIVSVVMTGNTKGRVDVNIDRGHGNSDKSQAEIKALVGSTIEKLAADVCKIIEKHMPIQLSETDRDARK